MFGRKRSLAQKNMRQERLRAEQSRSRSSSATSQSYWTADNSALERTKVLISNSAEEEERSLSNSVSAVISRASRYSAQISQTAVNKMSAARYVYTSVIASANSSIKSSLSTARSKMALAHQNALRSAYINASNATASAINSASFSSDRPKKSSSTSSNSYNYKDSSLESTLSNYGNVYQATRNINHKISFSRVERNNQSNHHQN